MRMPSNHIDDALDLAIGRVKRGEIDRRTFLVALTSIVGASALQTGISFAQAREIVVAMWGGQAMKHWSDVWNAAYTEQSGIPVAMDGEGPSIGKIRAMVESGNVTWDCCDTGPADCILLGEGGFLREIDYSVVDRKKLHPGADYKYGVPNYYFAFVLGYNTEAFKEKAPQNWVDFWNLKEFPGKRALIKDVVAQLEAALLGAGVPINEVYPFTKEKEELALEQIRKIRDETIFWSNGAEAEQLMRENAVSMGCFYTSRATIMYHETSGRWDWTWNQSLTQPSALIVPKSNPAGDEVWKYIASTQNPELQVKLLQALGWAPANPEATALVPADLKKFNATDPAISELQLKLDMDLYAKERDRLYIAYSDVIAS